MKLRMENYGRVAANVTEIKKNQAVKCMYQDFAETSLIVITFKNG